MPAELLLEGIDPIEQIREQRRQALLATASTMTFRQCATAYIASHVASWRSEIHRRHGSSSLDTYVYPVLGALPVQAIDVGLVMKVLDPIWREKPETADRVRGRIESS